MLKNLKKEIREQADSVRAKNLQRFFKTGKGQYGEGDVFVGLTVPESRTLAKKYAGLKLSEILLLLKSKIHEERLIALLILVTQYQKAGSTKRKTIFNFYIKHSKLVNNWDLVDLSAHNIVGSYLYHLTSEGKLRAINYLVKLAQSNNLWQRRIAIIATMRFIYYGEFGPTKKIALMLMRDKQDLIHKAVGWTLREMGKKSLKDLIAFLKPVYKTMPRTMLRYSIEKFPENVRKKYLLGQI